MKKLLVILCVLFLCCGCSKGAENNTSDAESTVVSSDETYSETTDSSLQDNSDDAIANKDDIKDEPAESEVPNESEKENETKVSTITAPVTATLYRDGKAIPMTDAALNLKIAQEIESWFAGVKEIMAMHSAITPEIIEDIKKNQTCIEFVYNAPISVNGKTATFHEKTRFILTLENDRSDMIILGDDEKYYSGPLGTQRGNVETILSLIENL